jgi:ribosomal protein L29
MKYKEIMQKTDEELYQALVQNKKELLNLRIRKGLSESVNPSQIRTLRKDYARFQTALSQRRIQENCQKEIRRGRS